MKIKVSTKHKLKKSGGWGGCVMREGMNTHNQTVKEEQRAKMTQKIPHPQ